MGTDVAALNASLAPCPDCKQPLIVVEGKSQTSVTFWMKGEQAMMTPHTDDCPNRGKALTENPWGVGPYGREDAHD